MQKIFVIVNENIVFSNLKSFLQENNIKNDIVNITDLKHLKSIFKEKDILITFNLDYLYFEDNDFNDIAKFCKVIHIINFNNKVNLENNIKVAIAPVDLKDILIKLEGYLDTINNTEQEINFSKFKLVLSYNEAKLFNSIDNSEIIFTQTEGAILKELINNFPKEVNKEKLLNNIWGYKDITWSKTLESHISNIRKKLLNKNFSIEILKLPSGYKLLLNN